jgi:hypothetical protein
LLLQLWQAAPPLPQALFAVPGWHASPEQQPFAHVAALHPGVVTHAWLVQVWLLPQAVQAAPPLPQALFAVPGWHVSPEQQPFAHAFVAEPGPQLMNGPVTQTPLSQRGFCPPLAAQF